MINNKFKKDLLIKISDYLLTKRLRENIEIKFGEIKEKKGYYSLHLNITIGDEKKNIIFIKTISSSSIENEFGKRTLMFSNWLSRRVRELTTEKEKDFLDVEARKCSYKHSEKLFGNVILLMFKETKRYKMSALYDEEFKNIFS
jgi:hypothetical protein